MSCGTGCKECKMMQNGIALIIIATFGSSLPKSGKTKLTRSTAYRVKQTMCDIFSM